MVKYANHLDQLFENCATVKDVCLKEIDLKQVNTMEENIERKVGERGLLPSAAEAVEQKMTHGDRGEKDILSSKPKCYSRNNENESSQSTGSEGKKSRGKLGENSINFKGSRATGGGGGGGVGLKMNSNSKLLPTIVALCCYSCLLLLISITNSIVQADDRKTVADLIRSRGFNVDEMEVISQNYPLKIYRIINPLADPKTLHKIPVVIGHGISFDQTNMMSSSANARPRKPKLNERVTLYALENGTDDRSLQFYLANNNYDVWIIENRATNQQTRRRIDKFSKDDKAFWDFSIDEQALFDLPTMIDYILHKTGSAKVNYIAYSQSTTFMFALLSMRPEYSRKLVCFAALAPVVFTSHLRGIVWPATIAKMYLFPTTATETVPEWLRRPINFITTYMCSISFIKYTACRYIWKQFSGTDKNAYLDGGMTEDVLKSTSMKTFEQFIQNALAHDFRMYDYKDEMRNIEEYGQPVPPAYNVSKVDLKTIILFRGTNDYLSDPEDQMVLLSRLRVPIYEDHILEDYSHIDFLVSPTVTRDINEPILRALDRLNYRPVTKVSHTLGDPNPMVLGTPLVMDVKKETELVRPEIRSQSTGDFNQIKNNGPRPGVLEQTDAKSVIQEMSQ